LIGREQHAAPQCLGLARARLLRAGRMGPDCREAYTDFMAGAPS